MLPPCMWPFVVIVGLARLARIERDWSRRTGRKPLRDPRQLAIAYATLAAVAIIIALPLILATPAHAGARWEAQLRATLYDYCRFPGRSAKECAIVVGAPDKRRARR